ncbi:hypothetical protein QBC37DRAFT_442729 [Rhypophila decipiens]|uniref:RBR-type E3 ubiquitin transferase n=1 Tax=Rhypophila decipiens TaxID=261697 RepID=A0AAN6Y0P1_9PEZI|nr:hypothetical protein QBC37DRAFT_442729 [Rhypophila decipiens]
MDLSDIEPESRALILELYIADLKAAESSGKGKSRADDTQSDFETALDAQRDELATAVQVAADEYLARLTEDLDNDELTAANSTEEEWTRVKELGNTFLGPGDEHESAGLGSSSGPAPRRRSTNGGTGPSRRTCTACGNDHHFLYMVQFPCSHSYCRECAKKHCQAALGDDTLFPPRCCNQPIRFDLMRRYLDQDTLDKIEAKRIELSTPNKVYCHKASCSTFVPAQRIINGVATCPTCSSKTCTICKSASHPGKDCPADEGVKQVLNLGRVQGWQRCYKCRELVELTQGCNHMICRCGAQFCYVCGGKWKSCLCAQFQEDYLITRANTRLDR